MERKYWVPAIERAHEVLQLIAEQPSKLKLMELSAATGINKSTMFSLLQTMEILQWVIREKGDTYTLGSVFAYLGNAYLSSVSLVELFIQKASESVERIGETIQLAKLDGTHTMYLSKKEVASPVRLITEPGMRIAAYATAMGKMLLSHFKDDEVRRRYADTEFNAFTPRTVRNVDELLSELYRIRQYGCSTDEEEVVPGFACIAAPICNRSGEVVAAASFSMPVSHWEQKRDAAEKEIRRFTSELSRSL